MTERDALLKELDRLSMVLSPNSDTEPGYRRGFNKGVQFALSRVRDFVEKSEARPTTPAPQPRWRKLP